MSVGQQFLAFETGGTKLVAGLAGPDARLHATVTVPRGTGDRASESLRRIVSAAHQLLRREGVADADLRAIGFGFGGTVLRPANRPHLCLHEEGWEELDVASDLANQFGVPVFVENDCKLAALAEATHGAGKGARSVFYVTLGTGVGGGFVRRGQIQAFGDRGEAEIGHIVVEPDGPECCCGNRGCVEALCSGPGLSKLCRWLAERHPEEWVQSALAVNASTEDAVPSERIMACWETGDAFAARVIEHAARRLAEALAATVNLLVPERIVVGGGLGTASPKFLDLVRDRTAPLVVPYFRDSYTLVPSELREAVVTQGAAILAAQRSGAYGSPP